MAVALNRKPTFPPETLALVLAPPHPSTAHLYAELSSTNQTRLYRTIARSFSAELMDIFRIENSVADLDEEIDKRYVQRRFEGP